MKSIAVFFMPQTYTEGIVFQGSVVFAHQLLADRPVTRLTADEIRRLEACLAEENRRQERVERAKEVSGAVLRRTYTL